MTEIDYTNARPLDVHRWSEHPEVNAFIDHVFTDLKSINGYARISKKLVKVILLDLYVAWCADPGLMLMFSRDNNAYKAGSRYNELHISKKIIGIVDALIANGVIGQKLGFNDRVSGIGFQSRLWASEKLIVLFEKARFNQFDISHHEDWDPIVLRNESKDAQEYADTSKTNGMRSILLDYIKILEHTHIDIYDLETPVLIIGDGKKKMRLQINQQDKKVRRIFNNSRWDQGGRFYGGWWQRCPKDYRKKIKFDGIMTAEIDFSGLHIVILYAQKGINYWAEVNEDPYELHGINDIDPDVDLRAAAKLLLLTAINSDDTNKTFKAFRSQSATGSPEKKMTDGQLSAMLHQLAQKHEPIAHKLASGAGIDLMYVDSQITEKLIEKFTFVYKCPILTVHDSYIVPFGYDHFLYQEMQAAFEEVTGVKHPVVEHTTEYYDVIEREPHPDNPVELQHDHYAGPPSHRHLTELELFRKFKGKPLWEDWVPDWSTVY
ncbi:hypothetical protein OAP54_03940 [Planktomarina temperata]|nr:hypothetical protein [Planktomarina temperata]